MFVSNCFRPTVSQGAASRKRLQPGVSVSPWRNDLDGCTFNVIIRPWRKKNQAKLKISWKD